MGSVVREVKVTVMIGEPPYWRMGKGANLREAIRDLMKGGYNFINKEDLPDVKEAVCYKRLTKD